MEVIKRNTDYALRVLAYMGNFDKNKMFYAKELAQKQEVSPLFLYKILQRLNKKGLVKSYRGRFGGGFSLNKNIQEITLKEIIETMQGGLAINRCFIKRDKCLRMKFCPIYKRLSIVQQDIEISLGQITLASLIEVRHQAEKSS